MSSELVLPKSNEHVMSFCEARLPEMRNIFKVLQQAGKKRSITQSDVRFMRRRTRSYHSYRITKKQKLQHVSSSNKSNTAESVQSPVKNTEFSFSRRYRRFLSRLRISNSGSVIRSSNSDSCPSERPEWLDTHIWHSKRMKMTSLWGYKLPFQHANRGPRTMGKFLKKSAVIQDISFMRPIRIFDLSFDVIRSVLVQFTDPSLTLKLEDMDVVSGAKECDVFVYQKNSFPKKCMGPASLYFIPNSNHIADAGIDQNPDKQIEVWLWSHPAYAELFLSELKTAVSEVALDDSSHVEINLTVSRFSIRGAKSQSIISKVLWSINSGHKNPEAWRQKLNNLLFMDIIDSEGVDKIWKSNYALSIDAADVRLLKIRSNNDTVFKNSPLFFWKKTSKQEWKNELNMDLANSGIQLNPRRLQWPNLSDDQGVSFAAQSELWNCTRNSGRSINQNQFGVQRKESSVFKIFDSKVSSLPCNSFPMSVIRKSERCWNQLPTPLDLSRKLQEEDERDFQKSNSVFSGWDIIFPSSWSSDIWCAFQFAGARAIGILEASQIQLEKGCLSFPKDFPDSDAGVVYWKNVERDRRNKIAKLPRKNTALCRQILIPSWKNILNEEIVDNNETAESDIACIRNGAFMIPFLPEVQQTESRPPLWRNLLSNNKLSRKKTEYSSEESRSYPQKLPYSTLISVFLRPVSVGVPTDGALIFCPSMADIISFFSGSCSAESINCVKKWCGTTNDGNTIESSNSETSTTRKVIGCVTSGGLSYVMGGGLAVGCCEAVRLCEYFTYLKTSEPQIVGYKKYTPFVMFQNSGSKWFRPAELNVIPLN